MKCNVFTKFSGVPMVTTPTGADGLEYDDALRPFFIAENPDDFVSRVIELYTNRQAWEEMSRRATEHARNVFSLTRQAFEVEEVLQVAFRPT